MEQDGARTPTPRRGDLIELTIDDWGDHGRGIGRYGRMVVLTDRGLPGERTLTRITHRRARHLEGTIEEILLSSPHRVTPPCRHFGLCGGCRLLDLDYPRQMEDKVRHLSEQVRRIARRTDLPVIETVPAGTTFGYRNKMEFSFGGHRAGRLRLGLHPRENYRDSFDLDECHLADPRASEIVGAVRAFFAAGPEVPYDPVAHTGFLRFVVVRVGLLTGDLLVNLVTADAPWDRSQEFGAYLQAVCPGIRSALWTVNGSRANIAVGTVRELLFGPGFLVERLGPFEFEIAADGFFQTNTAQAQNLFARVVDWAGADGGEVLDLYCGAGAISLFLSQRAHRVIGVESHQGSVTAARRNAARNRVANCEFICADVLAYLRAGGPATDAAAPVVVDPPRAGLHPKVIQSLQRMAPPRVVYVSCNTGSLARDLALFGDSFALTRLAAIDMFPHTPHIEAVALLERR